MTTGRATAAGARGRGFTLIELLVVLAIVATLLSIAAPRYFRGVENAREVALKQTLLITREAIDKYAADHGVYPASLAQLVEKRYLRQTPVDPYTERADTWILLSPPDPEKSGVYDLKSGALGYAADGQPLREL